MKEPRVLYEEKDFAVVCKPAGMLVHAAHARHTPRADAKMYADERGEKEKTLAEWLEEKYPEVSVVGDDPETRPGIVHRLDRDTSGVMLVARTQAAFEYFKSLFQERKIKKVYLALAWGKLTPKEGTIDAPIRLKEGTTKRTVYKGKVTKEAVTHYRVVKYVLCEEKNGNNCVSLVEVRPLTGRTHQIRVHLASLGHPIVGDRVYGKSKKQDTRLMLHALSLEFTTPSGKRIKVEAEPPEEFNV